MDKMYTGLQGCYKQVKKIKCTLVQATGMGRTAHRVSRGIALPFHDHGTRRWWGVSVTSWPFFTLGKDQVPIVQEAGWAPGLVWTSVENLAPTGIRSPDRPAHSQLLYRLCYPAHYKQVGKVKKALDITKHEVQWTEEPFWHNVYRSGMTGNMLDTKAMMRQMSLSRHKPHVSSSKLDSSWTQGYG